jgi:uncharacterized protein YbjT (DUF2867 family)
MEELIEKTGVQFRALRNGNFMENLLWQVEPIKRQGMFFYPLGGDIAIPTCAARDISASAVKLLLDRTWTGQAGLAVHGPADLSCNDMARLMTEVLGKPVRFQEVPGPRYKGSLMQHGSSEAFAQSLVDMFAEVGRGHLHRGAAYDGDDDTDDVQGMVRDHVDARNRLAPNQTI